MLSHLEPEQRNTLPDGYLVRALRAWSWEVPWTSSVLGRVRKHLSWREELQLDRLIAAPDAQMVQRHEYWRSLWCSDMYTVDSLGHAVTVQQLGQINFVQILDEFTLDEAVRHLAIDLELANHVAAALSRRTGSRAYKAVSVLDMEGVGREHMASQLLKCVKMIIELLANHYPETLWRMYCVNTSRTFDVVWAMVRPLLPAQNRERIEIIGKRCEPSEVESKLRGAGIDASMLPVGVPGGKATAGAGLLGALTDRALADGYFWRKQAAASSHEQGQAQEQPEQSTESSAESQDGSPPPLLPPTCSPGRLRHLRRPPSTPPPAVHEHLALLHDPEWTYACLGLGLSRQVGKLNE